MAAELAEGLVDGSPLPRLRRVSSTRSPAPPPAEAVRDVDEAQARGQVEAADRRPGRGAGRAGGDRPQTWSPRRPGPRATPTTPCPRRPSCSTGSRRSTPCSSRLALRWLGFPAGAAHARRPRRRGRAARAPAREELLAAAATRQASASPRSSSGAAEIDAVLDNRARAQASTRWIGPPRSPQCADTAHAAAELLERRAEAEAELETATADAGRSGGPGRLRRRGSAAV